MTSTTRSTSGSATTSRASRVSTPGAELDVAVAGQVAHGDPGDLQLHAGAGLDLLGLGGDRPTNAAPTLPHPRTPMRTRCAARSLAARSARIEASRRPGYGSAPISSQCVDGHAPARRVVGQRHGVAEVDAHVAGGEDRVAVERHVLQPARRLGDRHVVARSAGRGRPSRRTRPPPAPARRRRRSAGRAGGRTTSACRRAAGGRARPCGPPCRSAARGPWRRPRRCRRASRPGRRPCRARTPRRPSGAAPSATTTIENLRAAPLALGDRRGDRLELERDLRDQDGVGARRRAGAEGDPPGVAAHHLDDDHAAVRRGRREQPVDALRGEARRRCRSRTSTSSSRGRCRSSWARRRRAARPGAGGWRSSASRRRRP